MSIVQISQRDRSGAVQIGHLVNEICQTTISYELPMMLAAKAERLDYARYIARIMRQKTWPSSPQARMEHGAANQKRILKALNRISQKPCALLPITRAQAMRLSQLVLFCNRPQDWSCPHGPVIGATSAKLAAYLGVNDVNEAITPLLKLGLICLWNPQGNGRRWFQVINQGSQSETICGSGWSLAPLLVLIDQIEEILSLETQRLERREKLTQETRAIIRSLRNAVDCLPDVDKQPILAKIDQLSTSFHNARKGRLTRLEDIHNEAHRLLADLNDIAGSFSTPSGEEIAGLESRDLPPDLYIENSHHNSCTSLQGRKTADRAKQAISHSVLRAAPNLGLDDVGYRPYEAPSLFPSIACLADVTRHPDTEHNVMLARMSGIPQHLVRRAETHMGSLAASVALMLIAEKLDRGEITHNPSAYLMGMVKKCAANTLNLGYSVSWLRLGKERPHMRATKREQ